MLRKTLFILLLLPFLLNAQNYPAKPNNYVTDETGTLSPEQLSALNAKLKAFEDTTTNQIFVYFAESLNGQDLAQYSQDIFHNWRIGQKDKNNGVLITIFKNDHKFRIQTGYGLEGQLPDLLTKRIQDNEMRPLFKQNDYYGGIDKGIDFLMYYSRNAFDPALLQPQSQATPTPTPAEFDYGKGLWGILIGYSINGLLLYLYIRQQRKKNKDRPVRKAIFITIAVCLAIFPCLGSMILFFMLLGMQDTKGISSGGSYSSYSSSSDSSWSSSDSSSDFGGGGGGDSGGGGSSSDW